LTLGKIFVMGTYYIKTAKLSIRGRVWALVAFSEGRSPYRLPIGWISRWARADYTYGIPKI
jgi:hypothetical protein